MRNVKHGIIPPSGFRISSSPFRIPSVNASRLLAAGYICRKHLHIPMKTNSVILLVLWLAAWPFCCRGQGYISYDYLPKVR